MAANQIEFTRLEQRSVIKFFCWLRNANHLRFTEYVMCTEKHVLVKKMFTYGLNIGLPP